MALEKEIAAFEAQKADLMKNHMGKFVVFKDENLISAYDTFDTAAQEAIKKFGKGPFLIRQVTELDKPMTMPSSVAYRVVRAG